MSLITSKCFTTPSAVTALPVILRRRSSRDAIPNGSKVSRESGAIQSHDPDALLADYARLQAEAQALRDELKGILAQSLSAKTAASA